MRDTGECPRCGSHQIAGPHRIMGHYRVRIDLPGILTATLESYTCLQCGYTELYSDRKGLANIQKVGRIRTVHTQSSHQDCPFCGSKLPQGVKKCSFCGYDIR